MEKFHKPLTKNQINILDILSDFREWDKKWKEYNLGDDIEPESIDILLNKIEKKYKITQK